MIAVDPGIGNKPGTPPDNSRGLDGKSRGTMLMGLGVYLVSFLIGFVVRAVPEAIAYPAPIGYNTVAYYAPVLLLFRSWGGSLFLSLFSPPQFSPLAFLLMIPLALVLNPYTVLAVSTPAMHGILAAAVCRYFRLVAGFSDRVALLGSFFIVVQAPVLRLSSDMLQESLALSLGILILSLLAGKTSRRRYALISSMLVVTGLAHQVVLVTLLPCVYYQAIAIWRENDHKSSIRLLTSSIPALVFLVWNLSILQGAPAAFPAAPGVRLWFLSNNASSVGIAPFADYLAKFGSYSALVVTIVGFLLFLYVPLLPFVLRRAVSRLTSVWVVFIVLLTVSPLIYPWFAVDMWYLWAITLSVPVSIVAFGGFAKTLASVRTKQLRGILLILMLVPYVAIGVGYMTFPPDRPFIYFANSPFLDYMPSSMLANTMPLQDSLDALALLKQLNLTMVQGSVLLVHESFYGFAALSISGDKDIMNYLVGDVVTAVTYAHELGFNKIYWIWWTPGYGWHGLVNPPNGFHVILQSGRIAIYTYGSSSL